MRSACLLAVFASGLLVAGVIGDDELATAVSKGDAKCLELWDGFRQFVAEEHDVQRVFDKSGKVRRERRIRADYYIVRIPSSRPDDADGLLEFRDVLEVDGKPVRRDPARLMTLLTARGSSPREEACRIAEAANERNLFGAGWHINFTAGLAGYIHAYPDAPANYRLAPEPEAAGDETVVDFEETGRVTRAQEGPCLHPQRLPAKGRIHLARTDYNILKVDVIVALKSAPLQLRMMSEYQTGPGGVRVPSRRLASILHPKWRDNLAAQAEATYSNFRRFSAESAVRFEPIR
jgi:hypothetical protein